MDNGQLFSKEFMKKSNVLISLLLISLLVLTACGPFHHSYTKGYRQLFDEGLDMEYDRIIEEIQELNTINRIEFFALYKDQRSLCIDLFGIQRIEDVFAIGQFLNDYLENNPNSRIISDRIKMRIQCFENEPSKSEASDLWFLASISNCDTIRDPNNSEWNDRFIYLDVNLADNLRSSSFELCKIPLVTIWLPTNTIMDDYDVFDEMNSLKELIFSDPIHKEDQEASRKKREEIRYYDKKGLHFKCYVE